jgi:hypothetical protein
MKRAFKHVPTIALLLLVVSIGLADKPAKAGKPPTDTPVTSTIDGLGVDTLPTQRLQSDQAGSYKNSSSLSSILQAALGDWELDMINFTSSPQRKALIDLRDPVPGSGPGGGAPIAPFAYQLVRARFISKCSQNGIDMRTMQMNIVYPCDMAVAFDDASGVRYRLAENPNNFAETNLVQITCVATDANSKCNQWKIEPSVTQLNGERKNVAKLLKVATKPHQTDQDMGDFYLSFTIHVTNP